MAIGGFIVGRIENIESFNSYIYVSLNELIYHKIPHSLTSYSKYPNKTTIKDKTIYDEIKLQVNVAVDGFVKTNVRYKSIDKELIASWICEGYRRFNKRFARYDTHKICCELFYEIEGFVDNWLKCANVGDDADLIVRFKDYYVDLIPRKPRVGQNPNTPNYLIKYINYSLL